MPQIAKEAKALLTHHQFKADVVYGGTNISRCGGVPGLWRRGGTAEPRRRAVCIYEG